MAKTPDLDSCDSVRPQLSAFTRNELKGEDAARIAIHLAVCDGCTQEAAFARVLTVSGPRLPLATPPADLFEKIAMATYATPPRRTLREVLIGWLAPAPTRLAIGTAFAVSVAALVIVPRFSEQYPVTAPISPANNAGTPQGRERVSVAPAKPRTATTLPKRVVRPQSVVAKQTPKALPPVATSGTSAATTALPDAPTTPEPVLPTVAATTPNRDRMPNRASAKIVVPKTRVATSPVRKMVVPVRPRPIEAAPAPISIAANDPAGKAPEAMTVEPTPEKTIAPDITKATKVAMADPAEMRMPAPSPANGAAEEATGAKTPSFTFRGTRGARTVSGTILPSRSARDVGNGSGLMSLVQAPAKID